MTRPALWASVMSPAGPVWAAGEAVSPSIASGLAHTVLGLAIVLALIWLAAWALKRIAPRALAANPLIKPLATTAVGQRERVVLVEVENTWLVLGVAPGRVNTLHVLPKGELPQARSATGRGFDKLFARKQPQ